LHCAQLYVQDQLPLLLKIRKNYIILGLS
jgi:hypothetical protein